MGQDNGQLFIILAVSAGLIGVAAYFMARWLKGSITLMLPQTAFNHGETIRGAFRLEARKEINASNLTAALVGTEHWHEHGYKGRTNHRSREFFRRGQTLEHARVYPAGFAQDYTFEIPTPPPLNQPGGDSVIGQVLNVGMDILGGGRRLTWAIEVRLDAEGVDLAASQDITLGGSGGFFGL